MTPFATYSLENFNATGSIIPNSIPYRNNECMRLVPAITAFDLTKKIILQTVFLLYEKISISGIGPALSGGLLMVSLEPDTAREDLI